jgi:hypothetical protein
MAMGIAVKIARERTQSNSGSHEINRKSINEVFKINW